MISPPSPVDSPYTDTHTHKGVPCGTFRLHNDFYSFITVRRGVPQRESSFLTGEDFKTNTNFWRREMRLEYWDLNTSPDPVP